MDAKEYLNALRNSNRVVHLSALGKKSDSSRGLGLIFDSGEHIAVMLTDFCDAEVTGVQAGELVRYAIEDDDAYITGSPARIQQ